MWDRVVPEDSVEAIFNCPTQDFDSSFPRSVAGISLSVASTLEPEEPRSLQSLSQFQPFVPSATRYPRRSAGMTEVGRGDHEGRSYDIRACAAWIPGQVGNDGL